MANEATEQPENQLTEEQLKKLQEIHVPVNLKGLLKAWKYVTHDKPFSVYQTVARKIEGRSKKIMFGKRALIGMPLGIILRNTSRSAHNLSGREDSKFGWIAATAGILGVGAALAGAAMFGGPLIAGGALAVLGYVAATAAASVVLPLPVYTAVTLATSSVISAGVGLFSTLIAAPANLVVGYRRSKANLSAADQEKQLAADEAKFNKNSPTVKYQKRLESTARNSFAQLSAERKLEILQDFNKQLEPAAAQQTAQAATPANQQATAKAAAPAQP